MKRECRILELGAGSYFKENGFGRVDYYQIGKKSSEEPNLTFRQFLHLRRQLRSGRYDVVVASFFGVCGTPWHRGRGVVSNLFKMARCCMGRFYGFGPWIILWLLQGVEVPLVVVDRKDDPCVIPPQFFGLLKKCRAYYWRELPLKIENGFMYTDGRMEDTSAVRKTRIFCNHRHKIKPLSLGLNYDAVAKRVDFKCPKEIDVFFAGTSKGEMARESGLKILEELKQEGLAIEILTGQTLSRQVFLEICARSWLVYSPEGHGWDCFRHYEACAVGSVPLINYPRIHRHHPLIDQEHALYYGVEGSDLKRVIKTALADKDRLREMGVAARDFVLQHHTHEKLFDYILQPVMNPEDVAGWNATHTAF